jgi:hypothetical protein
LFSVPILAVANSAIRYIAARTWEHEEMPAALSAPVAAGTGPDNTSVRVDLPESFGDGKAVPAGTNAEHPDDRSNDAAPGQKSRGD